VRLKAHGGKLQDSNFKVQRGSKSQERKERTGVATRSGRSFCGRGASKSDQALEALASRVQGMEFKLSLFVGW
jgi:hypothetical protein